MSGELLPCPFCGSTEIHVVKRVYDGPAKELAGEKYCFAECLDNDHRTRNHFEKDCRELFNKDYVESAKEDWNARTPRLTKEQREAVKKAIEWVNETNEGGRQEISECLRAAFKKELGDGGD